MRVFSSLMVLFLLIAGAGAYGRPYSFHSGKWMWDNSDVVCAVRMTKWTVKESAPGQMVLVIEYRDLKSFKGAESLPQRGSLVMSVPEMLEGVRNGYSRECPDNRASLLFLKNESGILQSPPGGDGQFSPVFKDDGPLSRFQTFKELLLYAAGDQPDNSYAFFDLMTGFEDQELHDWLVAKSRSNDFEMVLPRSLHAFSRQRSRRLHAGGSGAAAGKRHHVPDLRKSFEGLIRDTEPFAKQPPL